MTRRFQAVIFDLDGVLWDGEPLYREAFNVILAAHGHRISDEEYVEIIGHSVEGAWEWVLSHFQLSVPLDDTLQAYDQAVIHLLKRPIDPLPGVIRLLEEIRRRGMPLGLASASLRHWVDAVLENLGLTAAFAATVTASEVEHAKPAPDLYLAAAGRLGFAPERCLAIEDTAAGLASAKAAGMFAVQVRAASTALPPQPHADLVIDDYSAFDLGLLDP